MPTKKKPVILRKENERYITYTLRGQYHREDGPAFTYKNSGEECWYKHGSLHREDGPAITNQSGNGHNLYYIDNRNLTAEQFNNEKKKRQQQNALNTLEKFVDKYAGTDKEKDAKSAVFNFIQGDCNHSFLIRDICELCK